MKIVYMISLVLLMPACLNQKNQNNVPVSLVWEMGRNGIEPGYYENTFYLINNSKDTLSGNWIIYYCQVPSAVKPDSESPVVIEQISSTYHKIYPSSLYKAMAPGDTLIITFRCEGSILKNADAPEGAYIVMLDKDGKESAPRDVLVEAIPFKYDYQWSRAGVSELPYPDGNVMYDNNAMFSGQVHLKKTDIFPSLKSVKEKGGEFSFTKDICINYDPLFENEAGLLKEKLRKLYGCNILEKASVTIRLNKLAASVPNDEYYQMELSNGTIEINGSSPHAIFNGTQSLLSMIHSKELPYSLPNVSITDYPDLLYRGQMLDVARNFSSKENVLRLIDLLSSYKINVLHIHLTDDEGWRLEIPGLEELTTVGARRGHTLDERECLYPAYGSGWNADNKESMGNGFYTRADFLEILKYAKARHIKVIPEVELPGHARAAIKAMEARYYKYTDTDQNKAEEYLLTDFADTSRYISPQSYTDNVINLALSSAYRFVKKIVDEVSLMYKDAGMELTVLHLGGDEVPYGAWMGSAVSMAFMKEKGFKEIRELKDYFIGQVIAIFKEKNIQLGAWQEVGLLPDETVNEKFSGDNVLSYCWNTVPDWGSDDVPYKLANAGYPVILCNANNLYFDFSYNKHQDEPGAYWGGFVNEYNSFDVVPYDIYKSVRCNMGGKPVDIVKESKEKLSLSADAFKEIRGMQGHLWAETVRSFDMIEYFLFPRVFGLIERAWNTQPQWVNDPYGESYSDALKLYNAKMMVYELPRLSNMNFKFRVAQPGIKIRDGMLHTNSPIPDAEIRYTIDGTEPNEKSTLWTSPVACNAKDIRAKTFYCGRKSVTTRYIKN
ncbi:MAG: carbohydate-binding domain-containing protein [Tannerellaceae bacterium]|jgi:hexosaminidase|nr:carbohydate-binding domain-containing protein [Tannerellaceae bacterium]